MATDDKTTCTRSGDAVQRSGPRIRTADTMPNQSKTGPSCSLIPGTTSTPHYGNCSDAPVLLLLLVRRQSTCKLRSLRAHFWHNAKSAKAISQALLPPPTPPTPSPKQHLKCDACADSLYISAPFRCAAVHSSCLYIVSGPGVHSSILCMLMVCARWCDAMMIMLCASVCVCVSVCAYVWCGCAEGRLWWPCVLHTHTQFICAARRVDCTTLT